jgi:hypothetical protein
MDAMLYCLVDPQGAVHMKPALSYTEVAGEFGLAEADCDRYRFDLAARRFLVDRGSPTSALTVQEHISRQVGSPDLLMRFADRGELPKQLLANLLLPDQRQRFLDACTQLERQYTEACAASNNPCLESGCSVAGGTEICLQPILRAGLEYHRACAAEWLKLFRLPRNRLEAWQN